LGQAPLSIDLPCKTDNPCGEAPPHRKPRVAGVRMQMNETVYLFALSVPALLEALVADQNASSQDTRTQASQERPS